MLSAMRVLVSRLLGLFRREHFDHAMDEEFQSHLEMLADRFVSHGMTRDEALLAAKRQFGGVTQIKEVLRERSSLAFVESLWGDARYALRQMRKSPVFTATAVLTLALGIGANTAIYSFMESILLRSLPVADPESLVVLNWHSRPPFDGSQHWAHVMHGLQGLFWPGAKRELASGIFPYPAFEALCEDNPVFSTLFGYSNGLNHNLIARGQATRASTEYVTGEYFRGLAVSPAA